MFLVACEIHKLPFTSFKCKVLYVKLLFGGGSVAVFVRWSIFSKALRSKIVIFE